MDGFAALYDYYDYEDKQIKQRLQETQTDDPIQESDQDAI